MPKNMLKYSLLFKGIPMYQSIQLITILNSI